MSADRGDGIADDADAYADLPEAEERPKPPPLKKAAPRGSSGIASDADLFADLLDESTDKARSLNTNWLYQQHGQVFGPVKSKELLEMLYRGEVDDKTPIAVEEAGEFSPLGRIGVFRAHLPKVERHLAEVRAAEAAAAVVAKKRLVRRASLIGGTVLVVAAAAISVPWFIISQRTAAAEAEARQQEDVLRKKLDDLLASVTIEPPLLALVDEPAEPPTTAKGTKRKRRRRRVAKFSGGAATTGELTRPEIMGGVAKAFSGIKRCIVKQIESDPESVSEQIVLKFSVNNEGRAQNVSLRDRFLRKSPLKTCMAGELGKVRWRAYKGEVRNVEYPISVGRR